MKPDIKRQSINQLLNSLEPGAFERVAKKLRRVTLRPKQVVYRPNEPIDHIFFPENVVLCLMTVMSNGDTIEVATVGREGASWISASVGAPSMPCETIVVIEGSALRLAISDLDRELKENGHFRDILTEYSWGVGRPDPVRTTRGKDESGTVTSVLRHHKLSFLRDR